MRMHEINTIWEAPCLHEQASIITSLTPLPTQTWEMKTSTAEGENEWVENPRDKKESEYLTETNTLFQEADFTRWMVLRG